MLKNFRVEECKERRGTEGKNMRVQLDMNEQEAKELERLLTEAKAAGVKTKKDLINNALSLLDWAINERNAGRIIASVDEKKRKYKEVVMPIFPRFTG